MSRSVILNVELDKVEPRELFLEHICEVFHANRNWLLSGAGQMLEADAASDKAAGELVGLFKELKPEFQEYILGQIEALRALQDEVSG